MESTTILIVDDHMLIRETWSLVISTDQRFKVIGVCSSGEEGVEKALELRPMVILMDIDLPGINGVEATAQICNKWPECKILAISLHQNPQYPIQIFKAGGKGYLTKAASRSEMLEAVTEVAKGNKFICKELRDMIPGIDISS